jgi:alpha-mannosidase
LVTSFSPYQPRTYALRIGTPAVRLAAKHWQPVELKYDLAVASNDDSKTEGGGMDGKGDALPAEMLPTKLEYKGIGFQFAPAAAGKQNALIAKGQQIALPPGSFNRVYIVAASAQVDQDATFRIGDRATKLNIEAWDGSIGQWDTRVWKGQTDRDWATSAHNTIWPAADMTQREGHPPSPRYPEDYVGLQPGYIKPASLVWFASHHHTRDGLNEPYQYSYLFAYSIDLPKGARMLTLPNNDKVRILAVSVADDGPELRRTTASYDTLGRTEPTQEMEQAKF